MRKLLCTMLVLFILVSLEGCMMTSYEDTNGEDNFFLQSLTDQDIIYGTNTTTVMTSTATVNNRTTCKAKTINGVKELFMQKMQNEILDIVVSCQITQGNARLVLLVDDKIVHDFALNKENQHFTLENVTGKVRLKVAGESAGYVVTYILQ